MILVIEFLFTILEGVRIHALQNRAVLQTQTAVESTFGSYQRFLWEQYRILGRDMQGLEEMMMDMASSSMISSKEGIDLLNFMPEQIEIAKYQLLTDDNGRSYIKSVVNYMKEHIGYESAKGIYSRFEAVKNITDKNEVNNLDVEKALESLHKQEKEISVESSSYSKDILSLQNSNFVKSLSHLGNAKSFLQDNSFQNSDFIKNSYVSSKDILSYRKSYDSTKQKENEKIQEKGKSILEIGSNLQKMGILELVIEDTSILSSECYDSKDKVSKRELLKGTDTNISEIAWIDSVLFQQYILNYFDNYMTSANNTKPVESSVLSYQVEYVIGRNNRDIENLKEVVSQILAIRQASNMMYLLGDSEKMQMIMTIAGTFGGITANPVLLEVIKTGLLTAWAFGESILDMRALLQGKTIPVVKNKTTWTLEIEQLENLSTNFLTAKESKTGMAYEDYLSILLFFQKEEKLAFSAMDLQEAIIRKQKGYEDFQMDRMVTRIVANVNYQYSFLFLSMQNLLTYDTQINHIHTETAFSYW
ncbi:MAG: hypothetical protein IKJ01_07865 [Lachnospiraceae bacterium]|nr:hypothetical protein [Lachnospiraceae bacterium]